MFVLFIRPFFFFFCKVVVYGCFCFLCACFFLPVVILLYWSFSKRIIVLANILLLFHLLIFCAPSTWEFMKQNKYTQKNNNFSRRKVMQVCVFVCFKHLKKELEGRKQNFIFSKNFMNSRQKRKLFICLIHIQHMFIYVRVEKKRIKKSYSYILEIL